MGNKSILFLLFVIGLTLSFFLGYKKRVTDENTDIDLKAYVEVQKNYLNFQRGALFQCHIDNLLLINKLKLKD